MRRSVLLIGATGVFGGRLARHLAGFSKIELILTSRSKAKACNLADQLGGINSSGNIRGIYLDTSTGFANILHDLEPLVVVDCSGPFQNANYNIAREVFAAGSHFVDLADARNYLAGYVSGLDEIARKFGVAGFAGASSTPALSSAVVAELTRDWQRVDAIDICITPGGKSEVGKSVLSAILSYAGKKIPAWREGKPATAFGWGNSHIVDVPNLGKRRVANVETYDCEYLSNRHDVMLHVSFSAGLESRIEQRGIEFIALLVKSGLMGKAGFLAPVLQSARKITRIGMGDRGGMMVVAKGLDRDGDFVSARWSLLAQNDHGPVVPVLPAAAALKLILQGKCEPGACLAADVLTLKNIGTEMAPYLITTQTDVVILKTACIPACLGDEKFSDLPKIVQAFHSVDSSPVWIGEADIQAGEKFPLPLIARILGFPGSGKNVPLSVIVERGIEGEQFDENAEKWTRNFNGRCFSSILNCTREGKFTESFGLLTFTIGLDAEDGVLKMPVIGWEIFGIKLPGFLAPVSEAIEYVDELGRFRFDVKLSLPIFGLFAHYRGWLLPKVLEHSKL